VVPVILAGALSLSACGSNGTTPIAAEPLGPAPAAASVAKASVALTGEQRQAVRIEAVDRRPFKVAFEAVGSVGFEEAPAIVQAESTLLGALATRDAARKELARVAGLGESAGIAPRELESARAADLAAAAAASAARDAVRALGVSDADVDALEHSGRFEASRHVAGATWIVVNVPESESARVKVGEHVKVTVPAFPEETFRGQVARVYATVDPATHRLTVRAEVRDPAHKLRPGMLADVAIEYGEPTVGIAIPTTAAVREPDGRMVAWVTTDRAHFTLRPLTLGRQDDSRYQVLAGLSPGELVVTEGGVFLSNLLAAPPSD